MNAVTTQASIYLFTRFANKNCIQYFCHVVACSQFFMNFAIDFDELVVTGFHDNKDSNVRAQWCEVMVFSSWW